MAVVTKKCYYSKISKAILFDLYSSLPQYYKLQKLQQKALKLDSIMRKMSDKIPIETLKKSPKWLEMVKVRQSLQQLLPGDHPPLLVKKRGSHNFNDDIQVIF